MFIKNVQFHLGIFFFEYENDMQLFYRSKDIGKRWRLVFAICLNFTLHLIGIPSITTNKNSKATAISLKPSPNKAATDRLSSFRWVPSWTVEHPTAAVAAAGGCHRLRAQLWTSPPGWPKGRERQWNYQTRSTGSKPRVTFGGGNWRPKPTGKTTPRQHIDERRVPIFPPGEKKGWHPKKRTEWSDRWDFEKNLWVV